MKLTPKQRRIHERAIFTGEIHLTSEADIIEILQEVEKEKIHKATADHRPARP